MQRVLLMDGTRRAASLKHTAHRAYAAWQVARADVAAKWNFMADKANLEPDIPRALRRAAEIVRTSPPPEENQETIDRAVDTLSAPYPERTVRRFRQAMNENIGIHTEGTQHPGRPSPSSDLSRIYPRSHSPRSHWMMCTW